MRKQPAATSTPGGARRSRASGRAASAARGTTDTVSAAVAGERRQPSTSSSTSRNSAAVRAADSSASVRLARIAGRCRSVFTGGAARTASAAGTATTATGTCTTKMACHENASVSSPPATGPVAVPTTPAVTHAATPRRSPYSAISSSRHPTSASAPPMACTHLAATSPSIEPAQAHQAEAPANTAMPTALSTCGRARTNAIAAGTAPSPSTRLNAISTHATCPTDACRCRRMSGSASVTTAESASTRATVTASSGATARRTRPSSQAAGARVRKPARRRPARR